MMCSVFHYDKFRNFEDHVHNHLCCYDREDIGLNIICSWIKRILKILELHNAGKTVEHKCKEEEDLKKATAYKRIAKMKKEGVIPDGQESADGTARDNY